jgi:DNA helicase-2/ATP-dependent DNA helicase PcrA
VQLLTVHGSKGLEWDYVAIPGLTENSLPAKAREGAGWLRFGELPYPFRGDRTELPELRWRDHETQASFDAEFQAYKTELGERHDAEERRLIYVATTRAQQQLLLTGSFWANGTTVRKPSRYLDELVQAGLVPALPLASEHDEKPVLAGTGTEQWPFDPLGARRRVVEAAAALVEQAAPHSDTVTSWSREVTLLLEERELRQAAPRLLPPPVRIPASRFKDYVDDPARVAAELRRPLPQKPYRATRLGTLFHAWVEERSDAASSESRLNTDLIDGAPFELDLDIDQMPSVPGSTAEPAELAQLAVLQATFERSPWAMMKPEEVEIEIHHVLAGQVFICKLDAVYRTATGYQVVDWKTGKAPRDAADLELKQTQLALYRLAFARWKDIDPETVDAVFYFVADDTIIAPERLYSEEDLIKAWSGVTRAE